MAGQFGKQGAGTKGYLGHRDDTTDPDKDKRECENCNLEFKDDIGNLPLDDERRSCPLCGSYSTRHVGRS